MEENVTENPEAAPAQKGAPEAAGEKTGATGLGKFKSVDALLRAYGELEAEFTRRSQRLKALEERGEPNGVGQTPPQSAARDEELYRAVKENEGLRARILSDYFASLGSVPLMTDSGTGVTAPKASPKSIAEAGDFAVRYLRGRKN